MGGTLLLERNMVQVGDLEIECHEIGSGEPLLFLHSGLGFFPEDPYVEALARGRRLIIPSHPGFGTSSLPDWVDSVDDIAHVHLALLDALGLDRVDVVGCSIGGWVAAEMGTMAPERIKRLVLVSPVGVKVGTPDRLDVPDIFAMSADAVAALLFHDPASGRMDPQAQSDERLTAIVRNRETLALVSWEPYMHNPKLKHRLRRLTAPTLFLRGESDGFVSQDYFEAFAGLFPNAETATIQAAGHEAPRERPTEFGNLVNVFLSA